MTNLYDEYRMPITTDQFGSSIKASTPLLGTIEKSKNLDISGITGITGMSIMKEVMGKPPSKKISLKSS